MLFNHDAESPATSPFIWLRLIVNQTLVDRHRQHLGAQRRDAGCEVAMDHLPYGQATSASVAIQLVGTFTSPSRAAARADLLTLVDWAWRHRRGLRGGAGIAGAPYGG